MKLLLFVSLSMLDTLAAQLTKCNLDAKEIPYLPLRKANFPLARTEQPKCDRNIIPRGGSWYKIKEDIVTNATLPYRCGTESGIWMKGNIPKRLDGIVNRIACVPGDVKDCEFTYDIKVENCGEYRMYFLPSPVRCNEAYCFGYGKSGQVPTNTTEKPTIKYGFEKKRTIRAAFEIFYFDCSFQPFEHDSYFYQIYWFANGQNVRVMNPVKKNQITQSRWTLETDLPTFNVNVSCAVSLTFAEDTKAGPLSLKSDEFFAGIKVIQQAITVQRGHKKQIDVLMTVPMPCAFRQRQDIEPENCRLDFEVYVPSIDKCTPKINTQGQCGISIYKQAWNKSNGFVVRHEDEGSYTIHRDYEIYLRTVPLHHAKMWHGIELPPIKVTVTEVSTIWQGKSCYAHSDPHMKTFDGITYDNQNDGTFVMYRSKDGSGNIMEVQTKMTECNSKHAGIFCNCAIAVRAAGDVYVINRCPGEKKYFDFKACHNNILMVKKINDLYYKFVFPTRTYLTARLWLYETVNVIEVEIFPSQYDVHVSEGLCSRLGSNGDLIARDKTVIHREQRPNLFSRSWRVLDSEDLIKPKTLSVKGVHAVHVFCTCENRLELVSNISVCKESKSEEQCNIMPGLHVHTTCRTRAKRSANRGFTYVPTGNPVTHFITRRSVVHSATKEYLNKTQAEEFCSKYMGKSAGFEACSKIPSIQPQNAIDNCVLDIQLTNSTSWATSSREGLKSLCFKELQQNNTLRNETKKGDGTSIVDEILTVSCPGECNNHGKCDNGTCRCDEDYTAADCSMNKNDPPILDGVNVDDGGLCDTEHCSSAFVEGDLFLDSPNLTCKMHKFQIPYKGDKEFQETINVPGDHNTISNIRCPFPVSRKRRSTSGNTNAFITGYKIAVSNNGRNFSPSHLLYILDSTCQDTLNISGELRFVLREGFCFINGRCIADAIQDESNKCNVCRFKSNSFAWTKQSIYKECNQDSEAKLWIIGVVLGSIAVVLAGVITIIGIKKKKNRMVAAKPPPY